MASRSTTTYVYHLRPSFCFNLKTRLLPFLDSFLVTVLSFFFKLLKYFLMVELLTLENQILHQIQYFFCGVFNECTYY